MISPRLGSRDFNRRAFERDRAGVVDPDRRLHELVAGGRESRPVVGGELPRAQALRLDLRLAAHHPLRHLGLRHLEREERHRRLVADGEVGGRAEPERRLPHRRARGEDHEVPRLEPRGELVEVAEAGGHSRDVDARLVELGDPLEALLEQRLDVGEVGGDALLGELEDDLLGPVDEVERLAGALLPEARDLRAGADEAAQRRHLGHDAGVVGGVRSCRHERGELGDPGPAADVVELAPLVQLVDQRDRVDRLALRIEPERGAVDERVAAAVEVAGVDYLADGADRARREQHRPEDGLLRLEVLRWDDGIRGRGGDGHVGCTQQAVSTRG